MHATSKSVVYVVDQDTMVSFGPSKTFISDNASCLTSDVLITFMEKKCISRKTVLECGPMSNGRAERMVGTFKISVGSLVVSNPLEWLVEHINICMDTVVVN